ncbi:hypothetical protein [Streptomyces mangrovi]|uniref:hypothetical protein n=1 Tax=Streptomyces mangrovi TaxID=1206892 RepID=UPI00399CC6AB
MDETKNRTYLVVAVTLLPAQLDPTRRQMNTLLMPRQRRLHFTKEGDPRRRKITSAMCKTDARAVIYDASAITNQAMARAACLEALLNEAADTHAHMLVIEQDDSLVDSDRRFIYQRVRKLGIEDQFRYEHRRSYEEALLWIPDAVAWCWAKKGEWRPRVESMIEHVHVL